MTLLPRPSIHLKKTLTRLKSNLCWNTIPRVFESEIWQRIEYFSVYHLGQKSFSSKTELGQWHSSLDPQFIWISPWLGWKAVYLETLYWVFEREIWQRTVYFFRVHPRSKILSLPDCTRTMTLLLWPLIHLNSSLTRLKSKLRWNTI